MSQSAITTGMTIKVHQHLDDHGVSCHHILRLLHLQAERGITKDLLTDFVNMEPDERFGEKNKQIPFPPSNW